MVVEGSGEIRGEIRVHGDNFRDVSIEFLDESNVVDHVARNSRLVILVYLLNQCSVPVQHGLDLPEGLVKGVPHLGVVFVREAVVLAVVAGGGCSGSGGGC